GNSPQRSFPIEGLDNETQAGGDSSNQPLMNCHGQLGVMGGPHGSKNIQGVGGRRYSGEKSGWIGEEWPVAGVPLAPEVPRSLVMDKGGRTARPRPRLRHTPLRPRRPRRHPQEVEARRPGKGTGVRKRLEASPF